MFNCTVHPLPSFGAVADPGIPTALGLNRSTLGNDATVICPPLKLSASASGLSFRPVIFSSAKPLAASLRTSSAANPCPRCPAGP